MSWPIGQSGTHWPRQCSETLIEDAPCIRARDGARLPEGVEVVIATVGAAQQRLLRCGQCGSTRRFLFAPGGSDWACRKCHKLDHTCRHSWGRAEPRTAAKLRQRLGGDPQMFSPLPPRPKTSKKAAARYD